MRYKEESFERLVNSADDGLELSRSKTKEIIQNRCKWWNRGYCREANKCLYNHTEGDCLDHLKEGCFQQGCKLRHRKRFKYWGTRAGCFRVTQCQYLHVVDSVMQFEDKKEAEKESDLDMQQIKKNNSELQLKVNKMEKEVKDTKENGIQIQEENNIVEMKRISDLTCLQSL